MNEVHVSFVARPTPEGAPSGRITRHVLNVGGASYLSIPTRRNTHTLQCVSTVINHRGVNEEDQIVVWTSTVVHVNRVLKDLVRCLSGCLHNQ